MWSWSGAAPTGRSAEAGGAAAAMRALGGTVPTTLIAALLLLHFTLRPLLVGWTGAPDLLAGGVLLAALHARAGTAALLGGVLGLLEGAMALHGLGTSMIVYALVGYLAARSRDVLFSDARSFLPLYVFLGVWAAQAGQALLGGGLDVPAALVGMPLSAASTAAVCWLAARAVSYVLG